MSKPVNRIIHFEWIATKEGFSAECNLLKGGEIRTEVELFSELQEACENLLISKCEEIYDDIALPDNDVDEFDEQVASDVLQGLFTVILKKKKL